ncbi:TIGR01777 family oxidoreductase [Pasteurella canis]|uniref:Epimerase n=1 Tax=Pasteurella canis TaxID=753 RepID=A0ABQ4VGW4_9PAST|nr:TIGR01777 family oxidoreductase [Pasteurella canis]UEC23867.1 TIGR01777 family oxidoreductase [Pasteurella canis]GJH43227.1 epimerase [Pasteurella canis]
MQILITGATGLIGSTLITHLLELGYQITALVRSPDKARIQLPPKVQLISSLTQYNDLNQFDAVINLAGEPIFTHRWTTEQKQRLIESRVQLTKQLTSLINHSTTPPHTFISGSATGYYGDKKEYIITEQSEPSAQFTGQLCQKWEAEALKAKTRVCLLRTGIVLAKTGGALAKMLPIYRLGLGGRLGNGEQYWSWITLKDMIAAIVFLLNNVACSGAFNLVTPHPVRNKDFNSMLGQLLKRPYFLAVPTFILNLFLGERVQLLLDSQKIIPEKLQAGGFHFQYPELKAALQDILKQKS